MNKSWTIKNNPFEMLDVAFKILFPEAEYTAYFETNIRPDDNGEKVYGLTDFTDNGEITIFIDSALSINDAVEIFAHELAHAGVGAGHGHDEVWEKAFDDLFNEYNKIGEELFENKINAPKGADCCKALKRMTELEMLEAEKYWCENCCNWDKEHSLPDGYAKCKLTGTLCFCQESGKDCKCFNVPAENVIVPPCKVGDTVYEICFGKLSGQKKYKTK